MCHVCQNHTTYYPYFPTAMHIILDVQLCLPCYNTLFRSNYRPTYDWDQRILGKTGE